MGTRRPNMASIAIEAEVRANVLSQAVGTATVADLDLPNDFLSRVVDRIIRTTFYERSRLFVRRADGDGASAAASEGAATLAKRADKVGATLPSSISIVHHELAPNSVAVTDGVVAIRGFRPEATEGTEAIDSEVQ